MLVLKALRISAKKVKRRIENLRVADFVYFGQIFFIVLISKLKTIV
jgi:hypothetical protein